MGFSIGVDALQETSRKRDVDPLRATFEAGGVHLAVDKYE
jgi:hypothetical protein